MLPPACDRWPDSTLTTMLTEAFQHEGDADGQIAAWTRFIDKSPDRGLEHGFAHYEIAKVLLERDRVADAMPHAEEAAKTYAGWGLTVYADALFRAGRFDEASTVAGQLAERYGNDYETYFYYRMSGSHGDADAVRTYFEKQADWADSADSSERYLHASIVYIEDGRRATLERELEREMLEPDNDGGSALELATFQMQDGHRDQALKTIESAANRTNGSGNGVSHKYVAGLVRYLIGNPKAVAPALPKDALDASTGSYADPAGRAIDACAMGGACELTGHVDRALAWYQFAMRQPAATPVRLFVAARLHKLGKEPFATTQP